ncbi:hypothetical protein CALCODRAFT_522468 [Calocera cornea HHB12733]|uniref:Uncharacterized protein n=1 Tax=Calocera cornea HHB12733 TaxID=1353952 RepID=A0A165JPJ5_9BASI|nr:hypothetical protein CALCODRAFT_522468 [Calocera cornea HHB12733]
MLPALEMRGVSPRVGASGCGSTRCRAGGQRFLREEREDQVYVTPCLASTNFPPVGRKKGSGWRTEEGWKRRREMVERIDARSSSSDEGAGLGGASIYFFYRPKVELEEASSLDDVSKFSILLLPRAPGSSAAAPAEPQGKANKQYRLISVGKKRLPDPSKKREVFWAAVLGYGDDLTELADELGPKDYATKTRGERHIAEARLAGRGSYVLYAKTDGPPSSHATYLAYHLSHPAQPGEVQKALDIFPSSSFVLQVKNPTVSAPPQAGLNPRARADYPEGVVEAEFGGEGDAKGLRFVPANPVKLLDYKGAELLLIADKKDIEQAVGEKVGEQVEESAEGEKGLSDEAVMKELMMDAEKFPAEALDGHWA